MPKGDVILFFFPFTDLSGSKLRPAVVLAETRLDLTVCFITSQLYQQASNDIIILPNEMNGIKKASIIKVSKIATLDKALAVGKIGVIDNSEIMVLNTKLKLLLQL